MSIKDQSITAVTVRAVPSTGTTQIAGAQKSSSFIFELAYSKIKKKREIGYPFVSDYHIVNS